MIAVLTATVAAATIVQPPACRPDWFDVPDLVAIIVAETGTAAPDRVAFRVLDCEVGTDVEVVAYRAGTSTTARVPLADTAPKARLRTLALAVAELAFAPATPPPPSPLRAPPAPPPRPPPPEVRALPPPAVGAAPPNRVTARLTILAYPGVSTILPGVAIDLERAVVPSGLVRVSIAAVVSTARDAGDIGEVALTTFSGEAGAHVCPGTDRFELGVGPTLAVGWGAARASTSRPDVEASDGSRWLVAVALPIRPRYRLGERWVAELDLAPTFALRGVRIRADEEVLVGVHGVGLRVGVGVGYGF